MALRHSTTDTVHTKLHRMADNLGKPLEKLQTVASDWNTAIEENDHDIGKFIFSDKRYLAAQLFDCHAAFFDFHSAVDAALEKTPQSVCDELESLAKQNTNLITYPVNGETIKSIAGMSSAGEILSPKDIYRLNLMFGALITESSGTILKSAFKTIFRAFAPGIHTTNEGRLIQRNLLALGVSKWAPDPVHPKTSLVIHAQNTIDAYLKFYLDIFTDFTVNEEDTYRLFSVFTSTDRNLMSAFAPYIIFKHGLTTSSAYKFVDRRLESLKQSDISDHAIMLLRKNFLPSILTQIPDRVLPKDFEHLNDYNPEMDSRAAEYIDTALDEHHITILTEYERAREVREWLKKDGIKDLHKLLKRNNNIHKVNTELFSDLKAIITSITPYSVLVNLQMPDNTYLALDINQNGIFGIPTHLYRKQPHIEQILTSRLLSTLIPQEKYNWKPLPKPVPGPLPLAPIVLKPIQEFYETDTEIEFAEKKLKKTQREQSEKALKEQEYPYPAKPPYQPKILLNIDDDTIQMELEKTFGKKSGAQHLDEVRTVIEDFGNGWKPSLKLWNSNVDANTVRVRWGKYRLKFSLLGDNCYKFEGIPKRDDAY